MAYVTLGMVQGWLNLPKYDVSTDQVDSTQESSAADAVIPVLEQRYDTSTWVDDATTPAMVTRIIAMLVASFVLRKAVSQDDGIASYCDWLEGRVQALLEGLVSGAIDLPGVDPDPTAPASGSVGFFPTDEATQLWKDETFGDALSVPSEEAKEEGAARWFFHEQVF